MKLEIINFPLSGIVVCLFVLFGNAAVDLIPCDKTRRVFTSSWGVITDGPIGSNYTQDSHCEWLIKANSTNKFITLSFQSMGTECSYDYVFVYDGDSFKSPLLGSFSGKTEPQQVIASSGYMLILLYSDTNYVLDGFRAEFSITDCPNNCSKTQGHCFKNRCVCESGWGGQDCSKKLCPEDCGFTHGRGRCEDTCICNPGFSGQACSLSDEDVLGNKWHWLSHSEGGLTKRAAHTAVYVDQTDSLYVFGGYNLNKILGDLEIYDFKNSSWIDENGHPLPHISLLNFVDPASVAKLIEHAGRPWEKKWGINSKNSFFRNLLYISENSNVTKRIQRHSQKPQHQKPLPRYGHSACKVELGFVIFGGKLDNGSLSNELWLYNAFTMKWELRSLQSKIRPPKLTRHTLTAAADDEIFLFGGSTEDGEFSSKLFKIHLEDDLSENWIEVKSRGGKELDVRVVAHSTVYHSVTNSLLVYGGIVAGVARFSKLSDRMFAFQLDSRHWSEIHYTREYLRDRFVPRERAFHTANILGNYLIVFGGYSHRHNKEEICYDNQMYLYHLGCHTWVNPEILGRSNDSRYPKQQGVFAHAATVRNGNTLLLVGGYHGNVNGDLLAYTVPPMVAVKAGENYEPEAACPRHRNYAECSADPECGWCSADELCYGRTVGANCTTNLQTTRCPGVCPALGDCHSCLIHGHNNGNANVKSAAHKLGLAECTWCVQNARCHHKDDNYGVCGSREDSPSQMPGWWGVKGTEVLRPQECRELDKRPGLTFVKYFHPVNFTQPDHVAIINATTVDFNSPANPLLRTDSGGKMVARLLGFLRPPPQWQEMLKVCISFCSATLRIGENQLSNLTAEQKRCEPQHWPKQEISNRVSIDFESHKVVSFAYHSHHSQSKMELQHYKGQEKAKVFTFEYLEPFANGSCSQYRNCLHCLTDSHCGWCDASNICVSRLEDESITCVAEDGDWRYLTIQPSACSNCSNYISCESCLNSGLCEWWVEDARCTRRGLSSESAVSLEQCPMPCHKRANCSACLEQKGRCVWCEATEQCFSFSVYTSEYQFGLCREWLDQAFPMVPQDHNIIASARPHEQCKSCSHHTNCSTCLSSLNCGWCYNSSNPISGKCVQGDFNNPRGNCSIAIETPNAKWAYAQCPDVDECGLGLHDCHKEAICTNTDGSFSCQCRRGYIGDGRKSCVRTCYNVCVHGTCQGEPNYSCKCDLGWTGDDCSINCGCNNHSNCPEDVGICEECQNWTEGEFCEFCKAGSFGNATTEQGCKQCECNGHGNESEGDCDIITGVCYCKDNTEGNQCERCKLNYYGDPRGGRQCYYQCEARGMLIGSNGQGISSRQSYSAPWGGPPTRECLWIINPIIESGSAIIQLQMNSTDLNVTCGENAVYVYDGLPELVDMGSQSALSAVFCNEEALPSAIVESRTGQLTVHYKQGLLGEGFSAMYFVIECENCVHPRICKNGLCICKDGFVGPHCDIEVCPKNCSASKGHGKCDKSYGRCLCEENWGGRACDKRLTGNQLVFAELFNTVNLVDHLEHLRKTLPRFGHSLVSDRRGALWMFGGYSLSHGPLNDIRLFDTRNSTWMQVTVDSTPDAKMPLGRYFHGADIVHSKQAIFVFGGLTKQTKSVNIRTLDDFWQFDIQNQRWNEIGREKADSWPFAVSGHTLTSYRNSSLDSLILIGGVSPQHGFMNYVWEFRLDGFQWYKWDTRGAGPLGIFGHTTVFHAPSKSLYVFGGYRYEKQEAIFSDILYVLNYDTKTWTNLNSFTSSVLPGKRFLHSSVTTDSHLYVLGGRISPWNISDTLYAYSYNCNQWINLITDGVDKIGPLPGQTYAQAMTVEPDGNAAYIIGGWGSDVQCSVLRLELPRDLCALWPNRDCLKVPDCAYCALKYDVKTVSETCHSHKTKCPFPDIVNRNYTKHENQGRVCDGPIVTDNCTVLYDCSTCTQVTGCQWCDNLCVGNKTCSGKSITQPTQCPYNTCVATDCIQCHQIPGCDWSYTKQKCIQLFNSQEQNAINTCAPSCTHYKSCSECLDASDCRWSTQLDECISASYQQLYCAGGVCGLVLQTDDREFCPEPCSVFSQCATCLRHANCGWCAAPDNNGTGLCTEGSSERPMHGTCDDVVYQTDYELPSNTSYSWFYVKCPPENECLNDHHSCNPISERCEDLEEGYKCVCGSGYKTSPNGCEPVCAQGCVRGQCIEPNKCKCDFGYVGANCSIQCQCNGHANCEGPDKLDQCLKCHNNTMGTQCEKCLPLFVGDPSDSGQCIPCEQYCNGHSKICLSENSTEHDPPENMDIEEVRKYLKEGPKGIARCLRCGSRTSGTRCDECIAGNFRGSEDHRDPCRPCDCHGHGDTCDPVTGEKCNCKNNTESDICPSGASGKNSATPCYMVQCSKCKEGYSGIPTAGHQCYKVMSMDLKMCFDAKLIDECKMKPKPLHPGEMVFFAIQPRYMNVDIRVIIDVTQGKLNVFMSTHDDTYIVFQNQSTGVHEIDLDPKYSHINNGTDDVYLEKSANGLRTYITVKETKTMLAVKGLKDRLVITLPEESHSLESTRFYLVLQAVDPPESDKKVAYGIVFFKQDQLHIDLFVFFSVFFSCFFLFLAACVVAWKAKQAADVRRAHRRHVVEMLHMAKRPFASVTLNLGQRTKPRRNAHYDLRPVAVEPTGDSLAAVATIFITLPGGQNTPVKLALASSLILLARQFPPGGRAFLRRRSTHAVPPT